MDPLTGGATAILNGWPASRFLDVEVEGQEEKKEPPSIRSVLGVASPSL